MTDVVSGCSSLCKHVIGENEKMPGYTGSQASEALQTPPPANQRPEADRPFPGKYMNGRNDALLFKPAAHARDGLQIVSVESAGTFTEEVSQVKPDSSSLQQSQGMEMIHDRCKLRAAALHDISDVPRGKRVVRLPEDMDIRPEKRWPLVQILLVSELSVFRHSKAPLQAAILPPLKHAPPLRGPVKSDELDAESSAGFRKIVFGRVGVFRDQNVSPGCIEFIKDNAGTAKKEEVGVHVGYATDAWLPIENRRHDTGVIVQQYSVRLRSLLTRNKSADSASFSGIAVTYGMSRRTRYSSACWSMHRIQRWNGLACVINDLCRAMPSGRKLASNSVTKCSTFGGPPA